MVFDLPAEPRDNKHILRPFDGECQLWWGSDKWGRKEWIGSIYPTGTQERDFLEHYSDRYNAIELHATHFHWDNEQILKWKEKVKGKNFIFCPHVPQMISHFNDFSSMDNALAKFYTDMQILGEHLGPMFMNVSEKFSPTREDIVWKFMEKRWPEYHDVFFELRHPGWFEEPLYGKLLAMARYHQIGLVIHDKDDRPLQLDLSIPKCYVRFWQPGNHKRLRQWAEKLKEWKAGGLREAYFIIHSDTANRIDTVADLEYFGKLMEDF